MTGKSSTRPSAVSADIDPPRPLRLDAQRSAAALIIAARELFATKGVDATTREIADRAGVGIGTLYRRFPRRADLIGAVFQDELETCASAATTLAHEMPPFDALATWLQRYVELVVTKRGFAKAVSSDDPVYQGMAVHFDQRLRPAIRQLYQAAVDAGEARPDIDGAEILGAVSALCLSSFDDRQDHPRRMVALFTEGLRQPK